MPEEEVTDLSVSFLQKAFCKEEFRGPCIGVEAEKRHLALRGRHGTETPEGFPLPVHFRSIQLLFQSDLVGVCLIALE